MNFKTFRKSKLKRYISFYLALSIIFEIASPSVAFALTSGPAQEEFASFEPASTSDMVDLYSGDYTYNIPLLSVPGPNGGYPINIAYHSGIGMEQEASWVGLGWNLNVGAINRQLRGLPDDFQGQTISKTQNLKPSRTVALDIPKTTYEHAEHVGFVTSKPSANNWQIYYNNYRGVGMRYTFNGSYPTKDGGGGPAGLSISVDSQNGIGIGLSFTASTEFGKSGYSGGFGLGLNINSRAGLQSINFTSSIDNRKKSKFRSDNNKGGVGLNQSSTSSFATSFSVPKTNMEMKSTTVPFNLKIGKASTLFKFSSKFPLMLSGSVYTSSVQNKGLDNVSAYGYLYTNNNSSPGVMKDFNRKDILYSKKVPHLGASSFTYDLYTQSGQGTGSMFRPHLNTFGILSDPQKISKDKTINAGLEVGIGTGTIAPISTNIHVGVDFELGKGESASGPWTQIASNPDMGSNLRQSLKNWTSSNGNADYEDYYFKVIGEKTGEHLSDNQLNDFGGDQALRLKISKDKNDASWLNRQFVAEDNLVHQETGTTITTLNGTNQTNHTSGKKRVKRSTSIEPLKTQDAAQYGYSKNVQYFDQTIPTPGMVAKNFTRPAGHLSEISMLQADGMRYVYGLPAYNNTQIDNCFAVNSNNADINTPNIPINTSGSTIGGVNVSGTYDEFVSKNEMPEYIHSWLLTSVLSNDYLDLTGDGPTNDDYGYWVKFNYKKTSSNYQWRAPYEKANFLEGQKNNPNDDKGSYTFGTKEIYVIQSIESKTHIAIFETSGRHDAFDALDQYNGGRGVQKMQRLDKIKLYTKREYFVSNTTTVNTNAIPTKIANFEYSYDLCPGVPNNDGVADPQTYLDATGNSVSQNRNIKKGKLTLNKIFFTYQQSARGAFSPYVFSYGNINDLQDNPAYSNRNMDRWGNFKNNTGEYSTTGNTYPYIDQPYTDQDANYYSSSTNPSATALKPAQWTLKQINLPSGGIMKIDYDFDDYAFVEKERALRMFDIYGLGQDPPLLGGAGTAGLQTGATRQTSSFAPTEARVANIDPNDDNRVWIKLEKPVASAAEFKAKYINNLPGDYVYFSTYTHLKDGIYDYVKGYAEIDYSSTNLYGINGTGDYGYITLKPKPLAQLNITGIKVSPFTRAALEHLRANRSEIIHNAVPYASGVAAQVANLLGSVGPIMTDVISMSVGFNNFAFKQDWGKTIALNGYSTIRLCDPDYSKKGGGIRVKKITLDDAWKNDPASASAQNSLYGLEYDYTTISPVSSSPISSGVAYEPQVGSEESPLKTPVPYSKSIPLHGSYNLFLENPIMEDYYPGPSVGYSKVTVRSIAPQQADIEDNSILDNSNILKSSAAPITIHEFYTQKDFPVLFDKTDMNPGQPIKQPLIIPGIYNGMRRRQTKSQGYSVVLNDMAGKQKSVTIKTKGGEKIISRQEFIYNTEKTYNEESVNRLSSKVQTLEIDNTYNIKYVTSVVGQEHDLFLDMNQDSQTSKSFGLNLNLDVKITASVPPVLLFFIMPIPVISMADNNLRTVVFNKVINRTGIIKKVITTTDQSTIITENLAFDIETGEALVTKVTNEFKDPIYNLAYPGHWYYPNLGGSYQNFGFTVDLPGAGFFTSNSSDGSLALSSYLPAGRPITEFFAKGDQVRINCTPLFNASDGYYTVFSIDKAAGKLYCINSLGEFFPVNTQVESIKVIKSGFKNMLSTKVGGLTFKEMDPVFKTYDAENDATTKVTSPTSITMDATANKVLNASAVEYSNDWQIYGGPAALPTLTTCACYMKPMAYDFMSMFQSFSSSGIIYNKNLLIHDMGTGVFSYGFNPSILNGSSRLIQIESYIAGLGIPLAGQGIRYSGELQSNGDLVMYFHGTNIAYPMTTATSAESVCKVYFRSSLPNIWQNIQSVISISPAAAGSNCSVPTNFVVMVMQTGNPTPITLTVSVEAACAGSPCFGDCWNFYEGCNTVLTPNYACGVNVGTPLNPYFAGMKGMWRPKASYAYNTDRTQTNNVRTDGIYTGFNRFPWENPASKDAKWINAVTITKYSPYGFELENKDALGNYSSSLYGYKHSLVVASGANAQYNELAFDNFEDYPLDCNESHFKFTNFSSSIRKNIAHTGKYSIRVVQGTNALINKPVATVCNFTGIPDAAPPVPQIYSSKKVDRIVAACDLIGEFNPTVSKKYVASVWVKQMSSSDAPISGLVDYTAPQLKITINTSGSPVVYTFSAKGNVIDGWQRIFEEFAIPSNATSVTVELVNTSASGQVAYFDDIRLHPFDANMVSYVYDPITLRVLAELDANNFATIYTYDDEGHLNNIKKETVEGVKTIKEGRINTKKINE